MSRYCDLCAPSIPWTNNSEEKKGTIFFFWWKNVKQADGKYRMTRIRREESFEEFKKLLKSEIPGYGHHEYRVNHQSCAMANIRRNVKQNQCAMCIDWSQNWPVAYPQEPQAMHFAPARDHVSLHTGVAYFNDCLFSFATASDFLNHGADGIWAHLSVIIRQIKLEFPEVETWHIMSDSPSSQYKSVRNFDILISKVFIMVF